MTLSGGIHVLGNCDLENEDVLPIQIKKNIPGKKIKSIEVLVRVNTDN